MQGGKCGTQITPLVDDKRLEPFLVFITSAPLAKKYPNPHQNQFSPSAQTRAVRNQAAMCLDLLPNKSDRNKNQKFG